MNSDADDLQKYADDLAAGIADSLNGGHLSAGTSNMQAGPQQDALAIAQNGGLPGQEVDEGDLDGETEADMDDDMMDKISSSPSIEDGGSTFTLLRVGPGRAGSPFPSALSRTPSVSSMVSDVRLSSPYLVHPEHLPPQGSQSDAPIALIPCRRHHQLYGEFQPRDIAKESASSIFDNCVENGRNSEFCHEPGTDTDPASVSGGTVGKFQANGSIARQMMHPSVLGGGETYLTSNCSGEGSDPIGTNDPQADENEYSLTVPYDPNDEIGDDDDDGDQFDIDGPRFLDSGWGGECLQDAEDIDFEFVYALHTFVATVEGQANATKGDTMVLLDDSNSYWWLVRVVKDSSIGMSSEATPSQAEYTANLAAQATYQQSTSRPRRRG